MATDIIVVGAGPAGSHLAMRLARRGYQVTLLDRKRFPRHKPCGEFMSPECLPLLERLGLRENLLRMSAPRVRGMNLYGYGVETRGRYGTSKPVASAFSHGHAIRRELLDEQSFLAAARTPGVRALTGHGVRGLLRNGDGAVVGVEALDPEQRPIELHAAFTVGADGLRSRVAGALGVRRTMPWLSKFALVARFRGIPAQEHAEVHFVPGGYLAACPVDSGLFTVNVVLDQADLPAGRQAVQDFIATRIASAPLLAEKIGNASPCGPILACGPLAGRTTAQTFDGAALVGDACGYVDPVTGEGMFFAMRGAELLAEAIDSALQAGRTDRQALGGYGRARAREFKPRYALARLLQRGLRHPRIARAVLRLLAARPRLMDLLVAVTGDQVSPRTLLRPGVWLNVLRGLTPLP
jgi:flavin-dependent dehydrogenase